MGSSSSHLVFSQSSSSTKSSSSSSSSASSGSKLSRTRRKLSQLFCGVFTPKSNFQVEDCPEISSISSTISLAPVDDPQNPILESSSVFTSEVGDAISDRSSMTEEAFLESNPLTVQTSRDLEPLPHQPIAMSVETAFVHPNLDESNSALVGFNGSDLRSLSIVSDSLQRFRFRGDDDYAHVTTTSSSGLVVSDSDQDLMSGDLLRLDLVSISSNALSGIIAEANSDESRRNSLRLFWDALSRRSLRRHSDAPAFVFATGLGDDLRSHDRWLLDFGGDFHYHGAGREVDSSSSRLHRRNERRWLLRSEVSERIDVFNEMAREPILCSSGLHPDGSCSCDSFFAAEGSSSLASISRIIMLAEALFEVLDEIHLQSLSLSLSTLSLPAPESVVDAFPLKYHKKIKNAESDSNDVRQCYICLSDYEEGDELRVLPCNHEFHVPCVDKWLKEVNRVCPLCRHDVCEGTGDCSVSNPEG